jgi:hypothetical protein
VLVTDIFPPTPRRLARLARNALGRLRRAAPEVPEVAITPRDVTIVADALGRGYGYPTEEAVRAMRLIEESEGVVLETTYSAKALAGLLRLAPTLQPPEPTILFWNTYSSVAPPVVPSDDVDIRVLPRPFHRFFLDT